MEGIFLRLASAGSLPLLPVFRGAGFVILGFGIVWGSRLGLGRLFLRAVGVRGGI